MSELTYETIEYDEMAMIEAIKEYSAKLSISALMVATKYNVPVSELHKEFAKSRIRK